LRDVFDGLASAEEASRGQIRRRDDRERPVPIRVVEVMDVDTLRHWKRQMIQPAA